MAVVIKTGLDASGANADLSKIQGKLQGDIGGALKNVEAQAKETATATSKIFDLAKLERFATKGAALKSVFDQLNNSMGLLTKEQSKATDLTLGLAAQGAAIAGPWGAAAGFVAGAAVSAWEWKKAADALDISSGSINKFTGQSASNIHEAWENAKQAANATSPMVTYFQQIEEHTKGWGAALANAAAQVDTVKKLAALTKEAAPTGEAKKTLQDKKDEYSAATALGKLYQSQYEAGVIFDAAENANAAKTVARIEEARKSLKSALDEEVQGTKVVKQSGAARQKAAEDAAQALRDAYNASEAFGAAIAANDERLAKSAEDAAQARFEAETEALIKIDEASKRVAASQQRSAEDLFNAKVTLIRDEVEAQEQAANQIVEIYADAATKIGDALKSALVDVGVGAAKQLFDNIEQGKKPIEGLGKAFRALAVEQLKAIGTTLIGEGLTNELKAAAMLIGSLGVLSGPAAALAGVGAAEIGAGLIMGGSGALLGRRAAAAGAAAAPQQTSSSQSLGSRESEASGPTRLADVKIYLGPENGMAVFSGDQRGVADFGRFSAAAQAAGKRAPR